MATTTRTAVDRRAVEGALSVSSFERTRSRSAARRTPPDSVARPVGATPVRHPRRDLSMFSEFDSVRGLSPVTLGGDDLPPLVPLVESAPLRSRRAATSRALVEPIARPRPARVVERVAAESRPRVRLTLRGYGVLLGLAVAAIAGTSAVSVAGTTPVASVASTEVVARAGESVDDVAARAANGRDVASLATAIEAANNLPDGVVLQAGDVLVVPGR